LTAFGGGEDDGRPSTERVHMLPYEMNVRAVRR
jgi:hypothetical protein